MERLKSYPTFALILGPRWMSSSSDLCLHSHSVLSQHSSKKQFNGTWSHVFFLLEQRFCIKFTFMNIVGWVDYYEKCYDLWHICLSNNQPTLISLGNDFILIPFGLCRRTGRFLVTYVKTKMAFLYIKEILMEFTFNFYPFNPEPMYPT